MVTEELDNLGAAEMCVQSEPDPPSVPSTESERAPPKGACFWPVTANVRPNFFNFSSYFETWKSVAPSQIFHSAHRAQIRPSLKNIYTSQEGCDGHIPLNGLKMF